MTAILSLKDPSSKTWTSKSSPDLSSCILLTDRASQIKSKIRGVVTDSIKGITYDPVNRPGTSNLLAILDASTEEEDVAEVATRNSTKGQGHLKNDIADAVEDVQGSEGRVGDVKGRQDVSRERGKGWRSESSAKVESNFMYG